MSENTVSSPPRLHSAVQLLVDNIAVLPSREFGVMNLLPFAHDSEQGRTFTRQVCEALIELLDAHGHIRVQDQPIEPMVGRSATVRCTACASPLVETVTGADGAAMVDAARFIGAIAALNPQCPHGVLTADDLRAHMQREFAAAQADDEAGA